MTSQEFKDQGYVEIEKGVWVRPTAKGLVDGKLPVSVPAPKRMGHILDLPLRKISIVLKGEPMPKQSVRSYANGSFKVVAGGKKVFNVFHYQPQEMDDRKKNYQQQLRGQLPEDFVMFTQRVHVRKLHYVYSPLKGFSAKIMQTITSGGIVWKETQPDLMDNLKKLVFDSMAGIVYKNDGAVVSEDDVKKYYGTSGYILLELEGI